MRQKGVLCPLAHMKKENAKPNTLEGLIGSSVTEGGGQNVTGRLCRIFKDNGNDRSEVSMVVLRALQSGQCA